MNGFKDSDGKFHPTDNDSKKLSSHQVENAKHSSVDHDNAKSLLASKIYSDDGSFLNKDTEKIALDNMKRMQSEDAIEFVHDSYEKIMSKTAKEKGASYTDGNINKILGVKDGEVELQKVEAVCGATAYAITKMLNRKFGAGFAVEEIGFYNGEDRKHSESYNFIEDDIQHQWVSLPDGTIIDNACGQFIEGNLNKKLGKDDRLKIIRPDDPQHDNYFVNKDCPTCGTHLKGSSCTHCDMMKKIEATPEFKNGMEIMDVVDKYRDEGKGKEIGLQY